MSEKHQQKAREILSDYAGSPHPLQDIIAAALEAVERELRAENAALKVRVEVAESVAWTLGHPLKSPFCEHSPAYSYTEDGGKTIRCLLCSEQSLRGKLAEERARLDAVIDNRWAIHRKTSCSQNSTTFSVVDGGGHGAQLSISADPREAIDKARAGKGEADAAE